MAAGAMHFIALVDRQVWSLASELDDCISFLCTQLAGSGTESLHAREWITLPKDIDLNLDEVLNIFLGGSFLSRNVDIRTCIQ